MTERSIRNLANLPGTASTTRVLNLAKVLNRVMLLKHRLRRDKIERLRLRRQVATKIILPIDLDDLRAGGRSIFVNEIGFDQALEQAFGVGPGHPDQRTLAVIDGLPGFDPFLLREQLRRNGVVPASCYFNLSAADLAAMISFVSDEIAPLVDLSLGPDGDLAAENPVAILTGKILSMLEPRGC
jgi:hypothetical protein